MYKTQVDIPQTVVVPLYRDDMGVMRVSGTRVVLDLVIGSYNQGATPEEIVRRFTSLKLADVYDVISWYLRHRAEVDVYLAEREQHAEETRREIESRYPPEGIKAKLLARLAEKKAETDAEIRARNDITGIRQRLLARLDQKRG
jgi:uncharacterized protein (DUF433 family)